MTPTTPVGPISRAIGFVRHSPLATVLFTLGLLTTVSVGDPIFATIASLLSLPIALMLTRAETFQHRITPRAALASAFGGSLSGLGFIRQPGAPQVAIRIGALLTMCIAVIVARKARVNLWLVWGLTGVAASAAFIAFGRFKLDIWFLHTLAAEQIATGASPYSGLAMPNGAPGATGLIEGYPYPAVAMIPFVAAVRSGLDPRFAGLLAWLVTGGVVAWIVAGHPQRKLLAAALILVPMIAILWSAVTEPVSLVLLSLTIASWGAPIISAVLLGLTVASKQYFVVLAPLILAGPVLRSRRRMVTLLVTMLAVGFPLLFDAPGYLTNALLFHLRQPPRADAVNLVGILLSVGITLPLMGTVSLAAGLLVAFRLRKWAHDLSGLLRAAAAALAATFAISPQAFPNYWLVVLSLVLTSLIVDDRVTVE